MLALPEVLLVGVSTDSNNVSHSASVLIAFKFFFVLSNFPGSFITIHSTHLNVHENQFNALNAFIDFYCLFTITCSQYLEVFSAFLSTTVQKHWCDFESELVIIDYHSILFTSKEVAFWLLNKHQLWWHVCSWWYLSVRRPTLSASIRW